MAQTIDVGDKNKNIDKGPQNIYSDKTSGKKVMVYSKSNVNFGANKEMGHSYGGFPNSPR